MRCVVVVAVVVIVGWAFVSGARKPVWEECSAEAVDDMEPHIHAATAYLERTERIGLPDVQRIGDESRDVYGFVVSHDEDIDMAHHAGS